MLANDEHVVALTTGTAERAGKRLNDNGVQIFHVKDGKVTETWFHPGDQYACRRILELTRTEPTTSTWSRRLGEYDQVDVDPRVTATAPFGGHDG